MIARTIRALELLFLGLSTVAIFAMMVIVCLDVAFRYALNAPLAWAFDLISMYLMVAIFFLALSASYVGGHHIRIDLLTRVVPPGGAAWLRRTQIVLVCPIFCVIAWLAAREGLSAYESALVVSGPIPWPTWPGPALVTLGSVLLIARLLLEFAAPLEPERDPAGRPLGAG